MLRREASIERQVRKAHRRMVCWRLVGDIVEIPAHILKQIGEFFVVLANVFMSFSRTIFYMELHYARQYTNLTGSDPAYAMGEPNRYGGMEPARLAHLRAAQTEQMRRSLEEQFEGDDSE